MTIRSVLHRGLKRFIERNDPAGLDPVVVERIRNMVSFLQQMGHPNELRAFPHWKPHRLAGNRKGTWSLKVSPNWRLTFRVDTETNELFDLNFEDYH